ncbi:MAG TPA: ATP synthase F1 subunit delta [Vicinamibacterales bacterium]
MTSRAAAARYARALLDVIINEQGNPEHVEQELASIADVIARHPELQRALTNPAVPVTGKRGVMRELTGRLKASTPVAKLMLLLADRDRLTLLPDLVAVYRERLMDYRQVVRAEVTTAMPLPQDRAAQLEKRLAEVTGRRVTMTAKVDPALIGGVVTRIGSTVYDGSIATHLATMKQRLLQEA